MADQRGQGTKAGIARDRKRTQKPFPTVFPGIFSFREEVGRWSSRHLSARTLIGLLILIMLAAQVTACGGSGAQTENNGTGSTSTEGDGPAAAASGTDSPNEVSGGKALTLMLYLCGSDLESKAGAASADLEEILASGFNPDQVNIVVMAGGTTKWTNGFSEKETAVYAALDPAETGKNSDTVSAETTSVGSVLAGTAALETAPDKAGLAGTDSTGQASPDAAAGAEQDQPAPLQGWEKKKTFSSPEQAEAPANMGEKDTLKSFLEYSYTEFPAQKYALIMWDHGGGPMRGLCWDTAWAKDNLTMEEFTGALAESPFADKKLSWIGFDACLMSSVETAHLVSPYAEYMIASEETEPSLGWSYSFLEGIEKDEDGRKTGTRIVDAFFEAAEKEKVESALTLSCTDLSKVKSVEQNLDRFFGKLSGSLDADSFSELSNMRQDTREFGKAMNDSQRLDLVDLGDLVNHYAEEAPEEARALSSALEEMVIYNRSSIENCTGLSSYHPYYNKTYYEKAWQKEYGTFNFAPSYTAYINDFAQIWMGDAMGDWAQMSRVQSAGVTEDIQYFSVQLTPEQMAYYASAQLLVLSSVGDEDDLSGIAYSQVYLSDDVKVDENGVLTAGYNGRTLYAVDDNGEVIAGPLNYNISDDGNLQVFGNYVTSESGAAQSVVHAMFECADAEAGKDLQVLDQYVYDEDANVWSNRLKIEQQDFQRLLLLHDYKAMTYDGDRLLAFSQWEDSGWMGGFEVYLPNSFHFRFFDRNLEGEDLFACFQISDTQANQYGTDLMPVDNPNVTDILFEEGAPAGEAAGGTEEEKAAAGGDSDGSDNDNAAAGGASGATDGEKTAAGGEVYTFENDLFRLTLQGEVNHSENSKYLEIKARLENKSDRILSLTASNGLLLSDGERKCICHPTRGGLGFYQLDPGEKETRTVEFSGLSLGKLRKIDQLHLPMKCELKEVEKEDSDSSGETGVEDTAGASGGSTGEAAADASGQEQESEIEIDLHPLNLDLTSISAFAGEEAVLAETTQDSLRWTLLDINQKQNGDLTPVLLCKNEGTEPKVFAAPGSAAVNGFVLSSYIPSYMEQIKLEPDTEVIFFMDLYNRQYAWGYYDHLSGSQHLAVADVLRSEGIDSVRNLTLLPARMFSLDDYSGENVDRMPLRFSLNRAVEIRRKTADGTQSPLKNEEDLMDDLPADTEETGTGEEEASAEGAAELTPEAMTRALDSGGKALSRTELFTENGVTVYGEHLLVVDRSINGSFLIENESEEDVKLEFDNWETNQGSRSSWGDEYISYAGTKMRIYLEHSASEPEETEETEGNGQENPDLLKEASLTIRKEAYEQDQAQDKQDLEADQETDQSTAQDAGQNTAESPGTEQKLPSVYLLTLSFGEGTAFNVDGGFTASFDEVRTTVDCITENREKENIFDPEVSCPEDPLQYKKSFSFTLPESLTEEQRAKVRGVNLWILRDCTSQLDSEDLEKADLCMQNLAAVAMTPEEGKKDTYSADYAGLVCVLRDDHSINISTMEDTSRPEESRFAMLGSGGLCTWRLKPDPLISSSSWFGYEFDFRLSIYNEKDSGQITDFIIDDEGETEKVSAWPLGWFNTMEIELGAPTYKRREDGSLEYQTLGIYTGNKKIPLDEGPVRLDMIPVKEFSQDIKVLYSVWFEDGSSLYYDGGEY